MMMTIMVIFKIFKYLKTTDFETEFLGIGAYDTFMTKTLRLPICLSLALKFPRFISQKNIREFGWYLIENEKSNG